MYILIEVTYGPVPIEFPKRICCVLGVRHVEDCEMSPRQVKNGCCEANLAVRRRDATGYISIPFTGQHWTCCCMILPMQPIHREQDYTRLDHLVDRVVIPNIRHFDNLSLFLLPRSKIKAMTLPSDSFSTLQVLNVFYDHDNPHPTWDISITPFFCPQRNEYFAARVRQMPFISTSSRSEWF